MVASWRLKIAISAGGDLAAAREQAFALLSDARRHNALTAQIGAYAASSFARLLPLIFLPFLSVPSHRNGVLLLLLS